MTGSTASFAQSLSDDQSVEAGRSALDDSVTFPWYDREADAVRRIDVAPPPDLKNRNSKWQAKPPRARTPWTMPEWLVSLLEALGWMVLLAALLIVGYLLVRAFLRAETGAASGVGVSEETPGVGHSDRVESLPFPLHRAHMDLLAEARRHYEAGNFSEAIIYLYSHLLVELDKHQWIRLAKGKTNRQYLREVSRRGATSYLLERTMLAFEDVFFGNLPLGRERFESCWNGLDEFHQNLEQVSV